MTVHMCDGETDCCSPGPLLDWGPLVRRSAREIRQAHTPSEAAISFFGGREQGERGSKKIF